MFVQSIKSEYKDPIFLFCLGWCMILLSGWIPVAPHLHTFINMWRVEIAASTLFLITLSYLLYQHQDKVFLLCLSRQEINFIILPLSAFIIWSGISMAWSPSWKSALYHTLIWTEYLIFYLIIRHILESAHSYKLLITLLSVMLVIIAMPTIVEYCSFMYFGGATTLGIRYSKYGEQFIALFPLIAVGTLRLNGRRFAFGVFIVTAMWLFIISTLGRTNFVLFVCGVAGVASLVFLFKRFRRYRRRMTVIILAMILASVPLHLITLLTDKPNVPIVGRISDETGINYSNNFRKLMTSVSLEMIAAHPIIGVGADNFGMQFNDYRAIYADKNPTDINLTVAENELAERSHNEFLQVFAELGAIGSLIFLWFLSAIVIMLLNFFKRFRQVSFLPLAALIGLSLFLASSAVSSFSFRLMQNGLVFFFVLAVAAKFLLASKLDNKAICKAIISPNRLKLGYLSGIAACLLLLGYCSIRLSSSIYTAQANRTSETEQAAPLYQTAFNLDDENPDARYYYGLRLLKDNKYSEAVPYFKQAIALGLAPSSTYSYLATAQTLSGDTTGAEKSFAEAVRLYPLSPFVHARYASLLQVTSGKEESRQQLNRALEINKKQANTWWTLLNRGLPETTRAAFNNENMVQVLDLTPADSVSAVLTEREIRFPAEKIKINFGN